jgi:hypothetical protein
MKPATLCFVFDLGFVRSAYVRLCVDSERSVSSGQDGSFEMTPPNSVDTYLQPDLSAREEITFTCVFCLTTRGFRCRSFCWPELGLCGCIDLLGLADPPEAGADETEGLGEFAAGGVLATPPL